MVSSTEDHCPIRGKHNMWLLKVVLIYEQFLDCWPNHCDSAISRVGLQEIGCHNMIHYMRQCVYFSFPTPGIFRLHSHPSIIDIFCFQRKERQEDTRTALCPHPHNVTQPRLCEKEMDVLQLTPSGGSILRTFFQRSNQDSYILNETVPSTELKPIPQFPGMT